MAFREIKPYVRGWEKDAPGESYIKYLLQNGNSKKSIAQWFNLSYYKLNKIIRGEVF